MLRTSARSCLLRVFLINMSESEVANLSRKGYVTPAHRDERNVFS